MIATVAERSRWYLRIHQAFERNLEKQGVVGKELLLPAFGAEPIPACSEQTTFNTVDHRLCNRVAQPPAAASSGRKHS